MYPRVLTDQIQAKMFKGKAIIVTGPRQTGKSTLSTQLLAEWQGSTKTFNCDNPTDRESLNEKDLPFLTGLVGNAELVLGALRATFAGGHIGAAEEAVRQDVDTAVAAQRGRAAAALHDAVAGRAEHPGVAHRATTAAVVAVVLQVAADSVTILQARGAALRRDFFHVPENRAAGGCCRTDREGKQLQPLGRHYECSLRPWFHCRT